MDTAPSVPLAMPATLRRLVALGLLGLPLCVASTNSGAETRGYVISWFATATYSVDFKESCPLDKNGGGLKLAIRNLMDIGYNREQATEMANNPAVENRKEIQEKVINRAVVAGQHVSVFNYPEAIPDPNIETVSGRFAYGFDLGGNASSKFEDPETHEKIDNQL